MSSGRRINDRRRRVLFSAHHAEQSSQAAGGRREVERLREARRPHAAYGSRVHRRLRGRWFSLVPVSRRSLFALAATLLGAVIVLCIAHWAAVSWPSIAYRPEIARPLRLDRSDSFGHCLMVGLLTLSTGASLLIYQLRRYRNDDFKGHYRLWRLVLAIMILACINAMVGMVDWGGAILDTVFGRRVALTGSDWIRLVVTIAGAVLAIRLIAEVRRCRGSLAWMIGAWTLLGIREAAKWNILTVDSVARWILVTSVPLLACAALFLSLVVYLRMLYREVRQIPESESLGMRIRQWRDQWLRPKKLAESDFDTASKQGRRSASKDDESDQEKTRWWHRRRRSTTKSKADLEVDEEETDEEELEEQDDEAYEDEWDESDVASDEGGSSQVGSVKGASAKRTGRRWFGLRRAKVEPKADRESDSPPTDRRSKPNESPAESPSKRSRFSFRLKPPTSQPQASASRSESQSTSDAEQKPTKNRTSGLGWFRRGGATKQSDSDKASSTAPSQPTRSERSSSGNAPVDTDDIDWNSLNKAERRRLRKQLKRQGRAA